MQSGKFEEGLELKSNTRECWLITKYTTQPNRTVLLNYFSSYISADELIHLKMQQLLTSHTLFVEQILEQKNTPSLVEDYLAVFAGEKVLQLDVSFHIFLKLLIHSMGAEWQLLVQQLSCGSKPYG